MAYFAYLILYSQQRRISAENNAEQQSKGFSEPVSEKGFLSFAAQSLRWVAF